jgi:16S rRNA (cytidine1402-2'-O)-methyltransferase
MLTVVATPIGNMQDLSPRARQALADAEHILAEDTRRAGYLLQNLGIEKKHFISFYEHNEQDKIARVLTRLKNGEKIALISDGGTPLISDPGYRLIQACREHGIAYTAVPGPCALINALVLAGFSTDSFFFMGFLPIKTAKRKERMAMLASVQTTVIMYESPYKVNKLLALLATYVPNRQCAVVREMTKIYEEVIRGTAQELHDRFKEKTWRGEITVIVAKDEKEKQQEGDRYGTGEEHRDTRNDDEADGECDDRSDDADGSSCSADVSED